MELDTTKTIYVGTDATNGTVHVLIPAALAATFDVAHLRLDDRDPSSTDAAEFKLLQSAPMAETRIDL